MIRRLNSFYYIFDGRLVTNIAALGLFTTLKDEFYTLLIQTATPNLGLSSV